MSDTEHRVNTRIDPEQDKDLARICRETGLSRSAVVRLSLKQFLEDGPQVIRFSKRKRKAKRKQAVGE